MRNDEIGRNGNFSKFPKGRQVPKEKQGGLTAMKAQFPDSQVAVICTGLHPVTSLASSLTPRVGSLPG
ncbi:hypothetical protein DPPLL_22390 [Desulfofustis limnaeus]|uniref:Uncharacterized protein n=1 Tax=Desulfofustis limnaeus TaxID=2740163 RepID=A0ABN6M4R2_9BACT|nr:hypothetical protein DPPLL_22390 [Desulfofustis limnaeus]